MKKSFFICLAIIVLCSASVSHSESLVVGYYPAWVMDDLSADDVDFDVITNIVYAFAWPLKDGSIDSYNPPAYRELIDAAHLAGRKVSVSFGGGGQEAGFPEVTSDPELRAEFIANIFAFCDEHAYDGADFDWEFPASEAQRDDYAALVRELREEANRRGREFCISMAISAASWPNFSNGFADLNDTVDWFFVMTYNYSGSWSQVAGHHAPLYPRSDLGYSLSVSRTIEYVLETKELAPEKVVLGIPFYGRQFEGSRLYGPSSGGDAWRYSSILNLLSDEVWEESWDDVAKVPYIVNADGTKLITFDNEESVAEKCRFALEKSLGGVGIWALGYDVSDGKQPLVTTIGEILGVSTAVASNESTGFPEQFTLEENYPNPVNPSTSIEFRLSTESTISLDVFSANGQKVATLLDGVADAGSHSVEWDASNMPSGVYVSVLRSGGMVQSKKMMLVK